MATLLLNNIFINYFGACDVIHAFSHEFKSGLNVLYGAEGSGKTTLLKAIAGLVEIKEGTIEYNGENFLNTPIKERDVVMVFDDLALRQRRSARFNLELPLRLRKADAVEIKDKVNKVAKEFGLSESILDTAVFRLSEEYKARVALARAHIRESKIIIFDNPLNKLSPDIREELFVLLLTKLRQKDNIIIYATNSSREAELTLANTVVLSCGYLTEKGYSKDFRNNPKSLYTAEKFIKYSCSYNITLGDKGGFDLLGKKFLLDINKLLGHNYLGKEVIAVVPPAAVTLGEGLEGTVINIITEEHYRIALIAIDNDTINAIVDESIFIGDKVKFDIDTDKIYLFDNQNEKTITK